MVSYVTLPLYKNAQTMVSAWVTAGTFLNLQSGCDHKSIGLRESGVC